MSIVRNWQPAAPPGEPGSLAELLAEVRRIEVQSRRLVTDVLSGGYRSTFRGAGVEFADVREYVEGDDPRQVDWNVTARVGRPFVKRFVEERELTVMFALDVSASVAGGFGCWSLRGLAARFCACLGLAAIQNQDRIGLVAGSERIERFVLPKKGVGHVLAVVRDCLLLPPSRAGSSLGALLDQVSRRLRRRTVVFLLSDFLADLDAHDLQIAARRHDLVAVRLLPREFVAPPPLLLRCVDPETGQPVTVDFTAESVRAAWLLRVAAWRQHTDEQFRRAQVDCIDLVTPAEPDAAAIAVPLRRFFRRRELREARR
jgi:uncharacterized protein (DUF58 family)